MMYSCVSGKTSHSDEPGTSSSVYLTGDRIPFKKFVQRIPWWILLGCFLVILSGCGKGIVIDRGDEYQNTLQDGWDLYAAMDYTGAIQTFDSAKDINSEPIDAYLGLGWSYFRAQRLSNAISSFRIAKTKAQAQLDSVDVMCGISGAYLASNQYSKAIEIVTADSLDYSDFILFHDPQITEDSVNMVLCLSYYHLGKYSDADEADPHNATYYLNLLIGSGTPYVYDDPAGLMERISEYQNP